ncbi:hypothetical protein CGRA01v4_01701 [Colletotrichum graminicola]|nr:hypothetical protein CGRA01v4_01701 [Colletotrichum graminicola]
MICLFLPMTSDCHVRASHWRSLLFINDDAPFISHTRTHIYTKPTRPSIRQTL